MTNGMVKMAMTSMFYLQGSGSKSVVYDRMFLGLPDPHPDPLVTSTTPDQASDLAPDPSLFCFLIKVLSGLK
jgi:hypothetical protein